MSKPLRGALASLLLSLSCGATGDAFAQVDTSVRYNDISYTLLDLDANDGVTPWTKLDPGATAGTATVFDSAGTVLDECTITGTGYCTAATADGMGTAWFDGFASGGWATWNTSGNTGLSQSIYGGVHVTTRADYAFRFAPYTQATFSVDSSIRQDAGAGGFSAGGTFYFVRYRFGDPADDEGWFGIDELQPGDRISTFTLTSRDKPMYGEILAYTDSASTYFPSPVPEPSAWAMLAGGLILLFRRRRARLIWHRCRRRADAG